MTSPFDGFTQGLMTGGQLGRGIRERGQERALTSAYQTGGMTGARDAAFGQGNFQLGGQLDSRVQADAARTRSEGITGALKTGDYTGAMDFASSPEELASIQQFKASATAAEVTQASQKAGQMAAVIESVQGLPPEQQLQAARTAAAQFGVDPNNINEQTISQLPALRLQALGLKAYLDYQQEERAAQRPIIGNGFISLPPGAQVPGQSQAQPRSLGATLPPGWSPVSPSAPPARSSGGAEMRQPTTVNFANPEQARSAISGMVPGVAFTSGTRSAAHNAKVGGVPTSNHVRGRAWDLTPPQGMTMAQLAQKMRSSGLRVLDEGDHVHVSW